jgi:glycosyltransferase involved in cell wall biosynthesis
VSFSNASYALTSPGKSRKVVFRQDAPADALNKFIQKRNISRADSIYANDPSFVESENRRNSHWIPVPLSEMWWDSERQPKKDSRKKHVTFVGSFSETKGWPTLLELVKARNDVEWILVSKYADDEHGLGSPNGKNWTVYRKLDQSKLKTLVANADLLIVASPYETQCLAALEALSQDTPVLTTPTGFLGGFPIGTHDFGIVSDDLKADLTRALDGSVGFKPRHFLQSLNLIGEQSWNQWDKILRAELEWSFRELGKPSRIRSFTDRAISFGVTQVRLAYRRQLKPALLTVYRRIRP